MKSSIAPHRPYRITGRSALWAVGALLLLAPVVAMQFTREVHWTGYDFAAAAMLLVGGGMALELVARRAANRRRRAVLMGFTFVTLALIWLQGAAGIF